MSSQLVHTSQIQLPMWPDDLRGFPNALARSALFNVANAHTEARQYLNCHKIVAVKGLTLTYTGIELRQDDEDVFLQLLHTTRSHELGNEVQFTAWDMLIQLKWTRNTASYARLAECIERLKATALTVTIELGGVRESFSVSLVRKFCMCETGLPASPNNTQHWLVTLEPEIVVLFGNIHYPRLD